MTSRLLRHIVPIAVAAATFSCLSMPLAPTAQAVPVTATATAPAAPAPAVSEPVVTGGLLAGTTTTKTLHQSTSATESPDGSRLIDTWSDQLYGDGGQEAAWSPDGTRYISEGSQDGLGGLISHLPNGTDPVLVDANLGFEPSYSPDGSFIVLAETQGPDPSRIESVPSDWNVKLRGGSGAKPWFSTPTGSGDSFPNVSAKNGVLLFQHGPDSIWTDHGTHTAGPLIADAEQPNLSPDGSTLAFVREVGSYDQLFTQAADGSGTAVQVTSGASNHEYPKWTPDGLGLDYNDGNGEFAFPHGRHLVLASGANTLIPNDLFSVAQQPLHATSVGVASTFHAVGPTRLLDTRVGTGMTAPASVAAHDLIPVQVEGVAGIPATGVSAVALNVTTTRSNSGGYLTAYPEGSAPPGTSNLNWTTGQTVAGQVIVAVGSDGAVDLANHGFGSTQLIADVAGYYTPGTGGSGFTAVGPSRLVDTRSSAGAPGPTPVGPYGTLLLQVAGQAGVPTGGVTAVVLNVTVTDAASANLLTVYPDGQPMPGTSTLNWTAGQTVANHVVVPVGSDGKVALTTHGSGSVDVVVDVWGYFGTGGSAFHTVQPTRVWDTRANGGPITAGGGIRTFTVPTASLPAGATAAVLNVTSTGSTAGGFLTLYPSGSVKPGVSNVNWAAGRTVANLATVRTSDGGIAASNHSGGTVDAVADLFGYYGG